MYPALPLQGYKNSYRQSRCDSGIVRIMRRMRAHLSGSCKKNTLRDRLIGKYAAERR